jgi:hypothetical protein
MQLASTRLRRAKTIAVSLPPTKSIVPTCFALLQAAARSHAAVTVGISLFCPCNGAEYAGDRHKIAGIYSIAPDIETESFFKIHDDLYESEGVDQAGINQVDVIGHTVDMLVRSRNGVQKTQ